MALKRWEPTRSVGKFMQQMFEEPMPLRFFGRFPSLRWEKEFETVPAVDMFDKEDELVVKAEFPGIDKDNIKISVSDSLLTIKGEISKEDFEKMKKEITERMNQT